MIRVLFPRRKGEARPRLVCIVLGPPPHNTWKEHENRRIQYYTRWEPSAPLRDYVPPWTDLEQNSVRLTATPSVSDILWNIVLGPQDPDKTRNFYNAIKQMVQE